MDTIPTVRFVVATRETEQGFRANTATGGTVGLYALPFLQLRLYPENSRGLPDIYNEQIELARDDPAILVFLHDDVHICDYWWFGQLQAALARFQVVGVAGCLKRTPGQACWVPGLERGALDLQDLSGVIGHGPGFPPRTLNVYGPSAQPVHLLDGVFMAVHSATLIAHDLRFDPRFDFHFYDLDFCRSCEVRGVTMGTWPISLIHASPGEYGSDAWNTAYRTYLEKWGG